jgi:hypothetical protein
MKVWFSDGCSGPSSSKTEGVLVRPDLDSASSILTPEGGDTEVVLCPREPPPPLLLLLLLLSSPYYFFLHPTLPPPPPPRALQYVPTGHVQAGGEYTFLAGAEREAVNLTDEDMAMIERSFAADPGAKKRNWCGLCVPALATVPRRCPAPHPWCPCTLFCCFPSGSQQQGCCA